MAKRKNMIKVDKARLYAELKKHNTSPAEASRAFGFGDTYISNACYEGKINKTTMLLLERFYGISRETYEAVDVPVETAQPETKSDGIDHDKLYQTIYTAVYHAYKQVLIDRKNGKF